MKSAWTIRRRNSCSARLAQLGSKACAGRLLKKHYLRASEITVSRIPQSLRFGEQCSLAHGRSAERQSGFAIESAGGCDVGGTLVRPGARG